LLNLKKKLRKQLQRRAGEKRRKKAVSPKKRRQLKIFNGSDQNAKNLIVRKKKRHRKRDSREICRVGQLKPVRVQAGKKKAKQALKDTEKQHRGDSRTREERKKRDVVML